MTFVKPVLIVIQLTVPLIYLKCISTAMICHRYLLYTFSDKELNYLVQNLFFLFYVQIHIPVHAVCSSLKPVLWIQIRMDPKFFPGSGSRIIVLELDPAKNERAD